MIIARDGFPIPRSADAITIWPFIFVRTRRSEDAPLIAHEMVHQAEQGVLQLAVAFVLALLLGSPWWLLVGLVPLPVWFLLYAIPWFRLHAEVRAYRKQIEMGGISAKEAATRITTGYYLHVSYWRALDLLEARA